MYSWFLTAVVAVSLCMIPVPASDYIIEDRDIRHYDPVKVIDKQEIACLAVNIYHEARGESKDGQIAVAFVTLNRVKNNSYPDTICGVVYQAKWKENWKGNLMPVRHQCQFSWFCDGKSDDPEDSKTWVQCLTLARNILQGAYGDITEGATHYHSVYVNPYWADSLNETVIINEHIFYK